MFERFTSAARAAVRAALDIATAEGAGSAESEHLLLALARPDGGVAAAVLHATGLDEDRIRAALDEEYRAALATAGLTRLPVAPSPARGRPSFGPSGKLALERSLRAALDRKDKRISDAHVLLGVLAADVGRVPRALAVAQVDRVGLVADVHRALDSFLSRRAG